MCQLSKQIISQKKNAKKFFTNKQLCHPPPIGHQVIETRVKLIIQCIFARLYVLSQTTADFSCLMSAAVFICRFLKNHNIFPFSPQTKVFFDSGFYLSSDNSVVLYTRPTTSCFFYTESTTVFSSSQNTTCMEINFSIASNPKHSNISDIFFN